MRLLLLGVCHVVDFISPQGQRREHLGLITPAALTARAFTEDLSAPKRPQQVNCSHLSGNGDSEASE